MELAGERLYDRSRPSPSRWLDEVPVFAKTCGQQGMNGGLRLASLARLAGMPQKPRRWPMLLTQIDACG